MIDLPIALVVHLEKQLGDPCVQAVPVSGGDINQARQVKFGKRSYFLKFNDSAHAGSMFEAEAKGLQQLSATAAIRIPEVLDHGTKDGCSYLLLELILTTPPTTTFGSRLGNQLASLHRNTQPAFGFDHHNFIGLLPQSNTFHNDWTTFYAEERLLPQFRLAYDQNYFNPSDKANLEQIIRLLPDICPEEPPALLHGDLWQGNVLTDNDQQPVLVDPAVCYGHREMDIAMTQLFGGFPKLFYEQYQESYPLEPGWKNRIPLYQLYYLFVHVNLFGSSYVPSVRQSIQQVLP